MFDLKGLSIYNESGSKLVINMAVFSKYISEVFIFFLFCNCLTDISAEKICKLKDITVTLLKD